MTLQQLLVLLTIFSSIRPHTYSDNYKTSKFWDVPNQVHSYKKTKWCTVTAAPHSRRFLLWCKVMPSVIWKKLSSLEASMTIRNVPRKLEQSGIKTSEIQKSKPTFTPIRYIIPETIKCGNPESVDRVHAMNQSLQKVLRKETSIISICFNEILLPQNFTFLDVMEYIFLLRVTKSSQMSDRDTLETTKHQRQRN